MRCQVNDVLPQQQGITIAACLWWSYFDWVIFVTQARLAEATGTRRAALARDAYSYLHLPMVGGIVLFPFGLKTSLPDVGGSLGGIPALGLVGGIALLSAGACRFAFADRRWVRARPTGRAAVV
jgi:low temperature requirement protein LtrA